MKRFILFIICLGLVSPAMALADVIYVSGEVSGVWSADTVFVTGEIFVPVGDTLIIEPGVEVLFQVNCGFTVDSAACLFAVGTETDSIRFDACIPGFHWHGIDFYSASDSSRLEYCLITDSDDSGIDCNYSNPAIVHCRIENCCCSSDGGGGIRCVQSSPTISYNVIMGNTANTGAAIYCHWQSSPVITGNIITGNIGGSYGAGIYCYNQSNPVITDNTISENMVIMGSGGAISCFDCSPNISGNSFINNDASSFYGGAIFLESSSPEISNNTFYVNSARGGGAIYCYMYSDPTISRNLFTGNHTGDRDGGAISCNETSNPTIINNTIVGNSAGDEGGGVYCGYACNPTVVNNIFWENAPEQIGVYPGSHPDVTYCDIWGGWEGLGNINENPLFVDPIMGDFHLLEHSPCIDAGDPNSPLDPDSTRADMGAYFYDQSPSVIHSYKQPQPLSYYLHPNYPNPFNAITSLSYELPVRAMVELVVYNVMGQRIGTLVKGWQEAGIHKVTFDGSELASGMYFCQLSVGDYRLVQKAILLK